MTEYIELDAALKMLFEKAMAQTTTESKFLYGAVADMIKRLPRIPAEDVIEVEKVNQIIQENKTLKEDNRTLRKYIEQMQTTGKKEGTNADVVEVVKCKDCEYKSEWANDGSYPNYNFCKHSGLWHLTDNHFCSYGIKKGKNNDRCTETQNNRQNYINRLRVRTSGRRSKKRLL